MMSTATTEFSAQSLINKSDRTESRSRSSVTESSLPKRQETPDALALCLEDAINGLSAEQIYTHSAHNFKQSGDRLRGGCPFHQSKSGSSFVVTISSKLFWCAGCGFGGSPADYRASLNAGRWVKARGRDFVDAVKELATDANVPFPERESSPEEIAKAQKWERRRAVLAATQEYCQEALWSDTEAAKDARHYLVAERGLTEEEIKLLPIGYYPNAGEVKRHLISKGFTRDDWENTGCVWKDMERYITFLWNDASGRPLTIYGRYFRKYPPEEKPKTIASPGEKTKQSPLYFDRAFKAGHKEIILVEGVLDAVLLQAKDDTRVCAYVAASCSGAQIETLKRRGITKVTLCGDPDHGGETGTNSNLLRLTEAGISVYIAPKLPDELDPDEFLIREGMEGWKAHIDAAEHGFRWKAQRLIESGNISIDKGKADVLKSAIAFCKAVKNHPSLDMFFWPVIRNSLGMEPEDFRAQLERLWASSPAEVASFGSGGDGGDLLAKTDRTVNGNASPQKLPLREAVEKATQILETQINSQIDSIEASILLEELRREAGVNEYNWEHKYLKPLREKLERSLVLPSAAPIDPSERKRLELKAIAQEHDPYKFTDKLIEFCRRTGWSRRDAEQQIRLFKTSTITPKAKRLKGKDFLRLETESISWVFPGIIPGRGVFVLGGNAGAGKTTCAYDAVGSLLLGEEFLGEKPVRKGKALVVTGDELPCYTQDKLIDRGIPLDNEDWDIILNWDVSQWDVLEEAIADLRPTLVIIDSFSSIHRDPSFDENSSQAKSTIYDLEALTNAYNCGCILIHHLSKSKENQGVAKLRGSSAIAAAASVVCLMEEVSDGSRKLSFPKVRGAQTKPFLVHLQGATGRYEVISGGDDGQTKSLGDRILEFLQKSPYLRFEQEEISQALGIPATNKDSVYQALGRLFKRGLITKRPSPLGGKRKVYGVANPSRLSHCEGLGEVINTFQETPPPPQHNVSVQIPETIDVQQLDLTDTLTDTLTDSELTPQNDVQAVSVPNQDISMVSAKLTDTDSQGERGGFASLSGMETVTSQGSDFQDEVDPMESEEDIADIAGMLEICNSKEYLADMRGTNGFSASVLKKACERLSPEKRLQIEEWEVELKP
ncbi:AAA family ATPase [Microcoleus sp. ZQ-A2]|nr:AAA family ATPase [Microcoleus sp. FACHB-1]